MGQREDRSVEARIKERVGEFAKVSVFARVVDTRFALREYQAKPAEAVLQSVFQGDGAQFAVMFSRQSGKDEMLAQTVAHLLWQYQNAGGSIVLAAPTFHPQAALMRARLYDRYPSKAPGPRVK